MLTVQSRPPKRRSAAATLPHAKARVGVHFQTPPPEGIDRDHLRDAIRDALERAVRKIVHPRRTVAIDVTVANDEEIRNLNAEHRGIDRATDALSFPQFPPEELRALWGVSPPKCFLGTTPTRRRRTESPPPKPPLTPGGGRTQAIHLGDIVVSLPTIARQARRHDTTPVEEVEFVVAHALLHLLGCDHDTPARRQAMWDYAHLLLWSQ